MLLDARSIPGKEGLFRHSGGDLVCRAGDESVGVSWELQPVPVPLIVPGGNRDPVGLEMLLGEAALMAEGGRAVPNLPPLHTEAKVTSWGTGTGW